MWQWSCIRLGLGLGLGVKVSTVYTAWLGCLGLPIGRSYGYSRKQYSQAYKQACQLANGMQQYDSLLFSLIIQGRP